MIKYTNIKHLKLKYQKAFGHNNYGKITSRHKGGGLKFIYKKINFNYSNYGKNSTYAIWLEKHYDPYKKSFLALIKYLDGFKLGLNEYILDIEGLKSSDLITFKTTSYSTLGSSKYIKDMFLGETICNIEFNPGSGAKLARSPGTFAKILAIDLKYACLKLPSGEIRLFDKTCFATIGKIKSKQTNKKNFKAGLTRNLNIKPKVRGVAMNAYDHPHGGGEGRSGIGKKFIYTPWKKVKFKTRKKYKYSDQYILLRKNLK
uniref:50S ribosomal protein L2 n=1 Tax=Nephromyces sp. ex Molgula occidentalis TaxID=2544991 RepID=A0A5C1H8F2_9APIC|nr:50S ribosomal protein L2 [Nephromyces sp. ex Molgula occidentalis]